MICPECQKQGLKSRVTPGCSSGTLAYHPPFYDEDGKYHSHDPNKTTTQYSCSNGHHWTQTSGPRPCWCGWPNEPKAAT